MMAPAITMITTMFWFMEDSRPIWVTARSVENGKDGLVCSYEQLVYLS